MGITGLIPFLEKASSKVHLKDLRGCTVAVDTYCWLHKGVFSCAEKLVRGEETDQYLQYCLKYVNMLLSYDIKPILVFDGQHLPAKALTERRRRESRQQSKKRAAELMRLGRYEEARSHMRRCVDVTHEMALRLICECRRRNVDCIVAPYEADAQMAWLNKVNLAQYVVTEDSDLTLFGAQNVIFKLDLTGAGLLVQADKLHLAMGCSPEKYTFDKFRRMCILSGCDYLDSLPGIGLAKACKFILKTEQENMWIALKKIPQYLNMRQLEVDDEYIENFLKAEATFNHMYIYNPLQRRMERLHELENFQTDKRYCANAGAPLEDNERALHLALGNLNPFTFKQLDNWHPDRTAQYAHATNTSSIKRAKHKSIWQANFQPHCLEDKAKKSNSCAIFFKKVDFIRQTIDADITDSIQEENAKPEEAEIFSMYRHEVAIEGEPDVKRKRCNSDSSSASCNVTPPASPSHAARKNLMLPETRTRHNPFARAQKSSAICENRSLLKVLSPKKGNNEIVNKATFPNGTKRSIFGNVKVEQVEVKSRFFAANVEQVTRTLTLTNTDTITELTKEIDKIEQLSQQKAQNQLTLYQTPSPAKQINFNQQDITSRIIDSGIETYNEVTRAEQIEEETETCDVINLSDDDAETSTQISTISKPLPIEAFKPKAMRRLGLSKPKTTAQSSIKGSTTKATKAVFAANSAALGKNQTQLSMFGFQKRPTLK